MNKTETLKFPKEQISKYLSILTILLIFTLEELRGNKERGNYMCVFLIYLMNWYGLFSYSALLFDSNFRATDDMSAMFGVEEG